MQLNSFVQADKVLYLFQRKTPFLLPVCQGQAARGPLNMGEQPPQQFFELFYGHGLHNVMQSVQGKGFDGKIPAGGQERAGKPGDQAAQNASRFHPVFLAHVNIQNSQGGPRPAFHRFDQRRAGGVWGNLYTGGQLQRRRCQCRFYGFQFPLSIVTNGNQHSLTSKKKVIRGCHVRIYAHDRCTHSGHQSSWIHFTLYPKGDARLPLTVQSENRPFGNFLHFAQKFCACSLLTALVMGSMRMISRPSFLA